MSKDLFEKLIADDVGHSDCIEMQFALCGTTADANYDMLQAKPANEAE